LFLKRISWVHTSDIYFNFLMLHHWLASHERLNIKWQHVFRTCLFKKISFKKCYQTKIRLQIWWILFYFFEFSEKWEYFNVQNIHFNLKISVLLNFSQKRQNWFTLFLCGWLLIVTMVIIHNEI
jgi:hypothetical protein